jgi:hypothetical protein
MIKPAILLLTLSIFATVSWSQSITKNNGIINVSAEGHNISNHADLPFFNSPADGKKIVASILDAIGVQGNFTIKEANVPNVEAKIRHHRRFIEYNPEFVNGVNAMTKDKWASIFIVAHEVGHHVEGHTLTRVKNKLDIELQADQFAGFALCKMGATLEQAQLAMRFIANTTASKTHPGRDARLAAIEKGWNTAESQSETLSNNNIQLAS